MSKLIRIGIHLEFAGAYGRGVLSGVMKYANLRSNWEFLMPPMYSLSSGKINYKLANGVIAMVHSPGTFSALRRARIPFVNTARTISTGQLSKSHIPTVLPNDERVGEMAFEYFWERNFRTFGFCGHPTASWSTIRRDAFKRRCVEAGVYCSESSAPESVSAEWIKSLPRPCAILAANDRYAWHAIDMCRENGISVPEEIAVLGVDNDVLLTNLVRPTLSSIDLGSERVGFEAARMLNTLMSHKKLEHELVEINPEVVITRHSTDVLNIEDSAVAEAVKFIREQASQPIGVEDVLKEIAMSRRNLERRFSRVMNRSLLEEIRKAHLDRAMNLLRETNLEIPKIAEQSGFLSHVRFSTVFREQTGKTPSAYRKVFRIEST